MNNKEIYKNLKGLAQIDLEIEFLNACEIGNLNIVKYLLKYSGMNKNKGNNYINDGFLNACENGQLNIIKYLINYNEIKSHIDNNYGFCCACKKGNLETVKYLLTSPELKDHVDIHSRKDFGFKMAYKYNNFNITKFLIFDMNIEKTKEINSYLKGFSPEKIQVENMFKLRELNKTLNNELYVNKPKKNKQKI